MQGASTFWRSSKTHLPDIGILCALGFLFFFGAFWKYFDLRSNAWLYSDASRYECYAHGFWQGVAGLHQFSKTQCGFLLPFTSTQPLHTLPREYPLLVLLPFTLALVAPLSLYHVAFACLMTVLMAVVYFVLKYKRTRGAAVAFLVYLLLGCVSTAVGRFDLLPSLLTLLAVLCAEKTRWRWAFALLALATMTKFYPLILVPPFLIAQQMDSKAGWRSLQRFAPLGVFVFVCSALLLFSLSLNIDGTLAPLSYFKDRPIQIESLSASILWLLSVSGRYGLTYTFDFGSHNVSSALAAPVALGGTLLLITGLLYIWWLQVRGKVRLPLAAILTLLVVMVTGKVFSPQYLLWVAPLIAYVGGTNWRWLVGWGSVSVVTTIIYPFLYEPKYFAFLHLPPLDVTVFIRNMLLLLFVLVLLYLATRGRIVQERPGSDKPAIHNEKYA